MSIFGKIKDAIFGHRTETTRTPPPTGATTGTTPADATARAAPTHDTAPVPTFDVAHSLDSMPGADRLNWRTSIVDLMKLIGVDSDYASRKALAEELGRSDYEGTAEDNIWLHRRVMQDLARHGGRVPTEYLD